LPMRLQKGPPTGSEGAQLPLAKNLYVVVLWPIPGMCEPFKHGATLNSQAAQFANQTNSARVNRPSIKVSSVHICNISNN